MASLPGSVLFVCDRNTIRSVMAEAIMKHLVGHRVFVDSAGIVPDDTAPDPFAVAAMAEIGLDISGHRPKAFDEMDDAAIDVIVTFTPRAQHRAIEATRTLACEVEYWPMPDPTLAEGAREARMAAYREVREALFARIRDRFPSPDRPA